MTTDLPRHEPAHPVVVAIGVSQDGIVALRRVLTPLSAALQASVLIVRHTSPTVQSLLSSILGRALAMPVKQADTGEQLQAGVVYVAPPNLHLTVTDGHVALDEGPKVNFARPSVDVLFESVARVCGARSIGVLLSGGGSDGAAGLAAIRRAGGLTIVQEPFEAVAPNMPRAALAMDGHQVLKIDQIGEVLRTAVSRASASSSTSA